MRRGAHNIFAGVRRLPQPERIARISIFGSGALLYDTLTTSSRYETIYRKVDLQDFILHSQDPANVSDVQACHAARTFMRTVHEYAAETGEPNDIARDCDCFVIPWSGSIRQLK